MSLETWIAEHRFGLGPRPDRVSTSPTPERLVEELSRGATGGHALSDLDSTETIGRRFGGKRERSKEMRMEQRKAMREIFRREVIVRLRVQIGSDSPFAERMVMFWSNHFTVSTKRPLLNALAGAFEREAIRPAINGRFEDLLLAVLRHPAMLIYLDNARSFGPDSKIGRRRDRGRNENLAREVLELHTLGVNGGYSQDDVIALANILTGWSIGNERNGTPGRFHFIADAHQPGPQTLLGRRYADDGVRQGEAAIRDMARHPSTATHIATKLARHFIADEPPPGVIKAVASRFLESGGDLLETMAALVTQAAPWQPAPGKIKTPHELVVASARAVAPAMVDERWLLKTLQIMGQPTFGAPSPAGWEDTAGPWLGGDAMMRRLEFAEQLAARLDQIPDPSLLTASILAGGAREETRLAVRRAPSARTALALLLASPGFQRR